MIQFNLTEKVALVTGGSRGIGKSIALELAQAGANIIITYANSHQGAQAVVDQITTFGVKALALQADAADLTRANEVLDEVVKVFGKIDIFGKIYIFGKTVFYEKQYFMKSSIL